MICKKSILLTIMLFYSIFTIGQKQQLIGIGVIGEMNNNEKNTHTGYALSYENQLSKNHGFEIGYNKRSVSYYYTLPVGGNYYPVRVKYNFVSLPLLYKFYNKIVNVSTGVNADFLMGWKDVTKNSTTEIKSTSLNPNVYVGWYVKVGKPISLTPKLLIEPEIHFNTLFGSSFSCYYGAALKLKYRL
ncbi:MAG: hypothetical protein KA206_10765 [Paludibacter sp.]|jgi:hypothetical protein|nr:hypothetical protein [Paludibacter sp.]